MKLLLLFSTWFISIAAAQSPRPDVVSQWLNVQTNIQSWSVDFVQTRTLKSLKQPLISTGQVWFAAPQNFLWQLGGNPPQTIAIRNGDIMMVVYPRLKRAEKYSFSSPGANEWRETLSLLQTGFPRSEPDLYNKFNLLSVSVTNQLHHLVLEPKAAAARKMMPRVGIFLSRSNFALAGTELVFADGSVMRNDFSNSKTNPEMAGHFSLDIPADYKIVEPLRSK